MKNKVMIFLPVLLCLLFVACSPTEDASSALAEAVSSDSEEPASSEVLIPDSSGSSSENASSETEKNVGIVGSNYTDIKLSLEQRGFSVVHPKVMEGTNYKIYNNNWTDSDSNIVFGCDMTIAENSEVVSASFSVENSGLVSHETFLGAAENYIKFCSTMPYKAGDVDAIKNWVSENMPTVKEKPTKKIGDAEFQLSGSDNAIILNVTKAQDDSGDESDSSVGDFYINKP